MTLARRCVVLRQTPGSQPRPDLLSTMTERSESDRTATRAETDARQRCIGGGRDAPDAVGAPGCVDRADLCRLWPATARTVLCRLTRRRTF
jgi:hypothetical protein